MALFDSLKRLFSGPRSVRANGAGREDISCEDALRLVHEFIDGELDEVSNTEVEAHFDMCKRCYPHLRLERSFREALHRACRDEHAPDALREQVLRVVSGGSEEA